MKIELSRSELIKKKGEVTLPFLCLHLRFVCDILKVAYGLTTFVWGSWER